MGPSPPLENLWEIPDCLWEKIQPVLLAADPPKATGRKRVDQRRLLNGIVYKLRSGCQWNRLPKQLGDDSTLHRTYRRWVRLGVFALVWAMLEEESEELKGVAGGANGLTAPAAGLGTEFEKTGGFDRQLAG
ncbi:MAG: transposase [Chloroflexi bacterium]|nr:transposase [Chloroflexota bacterium]